MPPVSLRASTAEKVRVSTQRAASTSARLQRLARLGGDRQRQVVEPFADQLGGAVEDGGALVLGEVGRLEGLLGGEDRAVDQRRVAARDPADDGRRRRGSETSSHSPVSTHSPAARSL